MGLNHSPSIVTNGLILALDPANIKSYSYSENIFPNSSAITGGGIFTTNLTTVSNAMIAPDGTLTGMQLIENTATNVSHGVYGGINVTANSLYLPYTSSIYVKANSRTCFALDLKEYVTYTSQGYVHFDVANNVILNTYNGGSAATINNATITPVSNGWSRCVITVTLNDPNAVLGFESFILANTVLGLQSYSVAYTGDGVSNLYIWGPQLQQSANVTPYIKTTGTGIPKPNIITDLSTTKNNGTLINLNNYNTSNGTIYFTGNSFFGISNVSNTSITLSSIPSPLNSMTAEVWIKPISANNVYVFGQTNNIWRLMQFGTSNFGFVCATSNNSWYSAGTSVSGTTSINLGSWYHVVGVYDGTQVILYLNGNFEKTGGATLSGTVANNVVNTYTNLTIGKTDATNLNNFQGQLGMVKLYNRALSNTEILQNFNAHKGRYGL